MTASARHISLLVLLLLLAGCERPEPVSLVDGEIGSPDIELLNEPLPPAMLGTGDIDSSLLVQADAGSAFAQLIVAGSVYDGLYVHREASLARALLFDRSAPVLNGRGDTVGFRAVDAGTITLDDAALARRDKRVALRDLPGDTLLGPQYVATGGASGFAFTGGHLYTWRNPVTTFASPLEAAIESPAAIRVTTPTPAASVDLRRNLRLAWDGGGPTVRIVVNDATTLRPLIRMRVRHNRGWAIIPRSVLRLLPAERTAFILTVASDRAVTVRADGFPDDILVQATTSHSLYLQCTN